MFNCKVGGAPLNVAVGLNRLGEKPLLVSAVGDDWFGNNTISYLEVNEVPYSITTSVDLPTRTAVVVHDEDRERAFYFSSGLAAENAIELDKYVGSKKLKYDVIYFGSFPFARGSSLSVFRQYVNSARAAGVAAVFDPNVRLGVFRRASEARRICRDLVTLSDVVRLNVDELRFLYGPKSGPNTPDIVKRCAEALLKDGPRAVFVTDGAVGSYFLVDGQFVFVKSFRVKTVDSTGCGDAFTAALISRYFDNRGALTKDYAGLLRWANAAGAFAATRLGGADSMPTKVQIQHIINSNSRGGETAKQFVPSTSVKKVSKQKGGLSK